MRYVPPGGDTEEALVRAAETLIDEIERLMLSRVRVVKLPEGYGIETRSAVQATERLRQVLLNYERRKLFSPRSSVEREQAASTRKVGGSNPSGGASV
jgi:hypothetical protein